MAVKFAVLLKRHEGSRESTRRIGVTSQKTAACRKSRVSQRALVVWPNRAPPTLRS
jgi:hypothetical protein